MENSAQPAFVNQLFGESNGRNAPVVVPNHVGHFGVFHSFDHRFRFRRIASQRLFAHDHLAGFRSGNRNLGVRVVRAGDIDQVDILVVYECSPVRNGRFITPPVSKQHGLFAVSRTDAFQNRLVRRVEEIRHLAKRVRMRAAHEAAADDSNVQFFHC